MAISQTPNKEIMKKARETLHGHMPLTAFTAFAYLTLSFSASAINRLGDMVSFLINGPLSAGAAFYFLGLIRKKEPGFEILFIGFSRYFKVLGIHFFIMINFLIRLPLLIFPAFISALRYSQCYFLWVDNPDIKPLEALRQSSALMEGNKMKLFQLYCRFIGWGLLCIPTFGIGLLWLLPYVLTSAGHFYLEITDAQNNTGACTLEKELDLTYCPVKDHSLLKKDTI